MTNGPSTVKNNEQDLAFTGTGGVDKAREVASAVADKARGAASSVAHTVGQASSTVGVKADEATSAVGGGMKSLAGTIRDNSPREGVVGTASSAVASSLESGGRYLQEEGLGGIANEITNLVRRNPIPAVLAGIGIGFLLAKMTTRS